MPSYMYKNKKKKTKKTKRRKKKIGRAEEN